MQTIAQSKDSTIKKFALSEDDTGSSSVQIGLITERIKKIARHLESFPKDKHSRLGLLKLVRKRRSHFNYLKRSNRDVHDSLVQLIKK